MISLVGNMVFTVKHSRFDLVVESGTSLLDGFILGVVHPVPLLFLRVYHK